MVRMRFEFLFQFLEIRFLDGIRTQFNFSVWLATASLTSDLRNPKTYIRQRNVDRKSEDVGQKSPHQLGLVAVALKQS